MCLNHLFSFGAMFSRKKGGRSCVQTRPSSTRRLRSGSSSTCDGSWSTCDASCSTYNGSWSTVRSTMWWFLIYLWWFLIYLFCSGVQFRTFLFFDVVALHLPCGGSWSTMWWILIYNVVVLDLPGGGAQDPSGRATRSRSRTTRSRLSTTTSKIADQEPLHQGGTCEERGGG